MKLRGDDELPELPAELEVFHEWLWDGDKNAWIAAQVEWMRQNMTVEQVAERMTRRRLAIRRETWRLWRERLAREAENDNN